MSRIGKKPIPLPAGVKYTVEGNTVLVEGPKGKVSALIAPGISLVKEGNVLNIERESDKAAAFHGLTRALVYNAVHGVTQGWTKDLDIVGIGYRAELKGKAMVVFTLGYSHPIEFPLPTGIEVTIDPKQTHRRYALVAQAGSVQEQGRALYRREAEEEGRQVRLQVIANRTGPQGGSADRKRRR
jgi:large subunit ribosomal protein L6